MGLLGPVSDLMRIETRWTMLPPPPAADDPDWEQGWRFLFETYQPAMQRYVRGLLSRLLRRSVAPEEAEEVVQDYLSHCIEKAWLSRDACAIRSFRRYLRTQLYRFTHDWLDRRLAQKRAPEGLKSADMLDDLPVEPDDELVAELDRGLVEVAQERALAHLAAANEEQAELIRDLLRTGGEGSPDLAERLGRPERQLKVLRHRARRAFALHFLEELQSTTRDLESFGVLLRGLESHLP